MDIIIIMIAQIALALSVLRWGVNSSDGINSPEWNAGSAGMAFTTSHNITRNTLRLKNYQ